MYPVKYTCLPKFLPNAIKCDSMERNSEFRIPPLAETRSPDHSRECSLLRGDSVETPEDIFQRKNELVGMPRSTVE